jgi:hypothetical protein
VLENVEAPVTARVELRTAAPPMVVAPVTSSVDDNTAAPPIVVAPEKLAVVPVTEEDITTALLNVAVPVTDAPERISAVVATILAVVMVSPEDPSIKSFSWAICSRIALFTSEGNIFSPINIPPMSVLSAAVLLY